MDRRADQTPAVFTPPPGNPRFPLFDAYRGIGAIGVVVGHCGMVIGLAEVGLSGAVFRQLQALVGVFFLVSGFLIYRPFLVGRFGGRSAPRVRDYARRRFLRIVPAYWFAVTALALYPGLVGVFTSDWPIYYFFGQIYSARTIVNGDVPAWTLCTEVTFYALLPIYAALMRRWPAANTNVVVRQETLVLVVLSVASVTFRWGTASSSYLPYTLPATFFWFALGMWLAVASCAVEKHRRERPIINIISAWPSLCWLAAAATLMGAAYVDQHHWPAEAQHVIFGIAGLIFVLPAVFGDNRTGIARRILGSPLLAWLGLVSYGVYLFHMPIVWWFRQHGADAWLPSGLASMTLAVMAVTIPCAAVSYYAVERPANNRKERRRRRNERLLQRHATARVDQTPKAVPVP